MNGAERVIAGKSRFLRAVLEGSSLEELIRDYCEATVRRAYELGE